MAETIMPSFSEQDSLDTVSTDLGSKSSASSVTGNDAFSKINTLNSKINAITLTDNELITEATLTGYSSIADLQINDDAFYCLVCSNDSSSATNIIVDFMTKNLITIWQFNYINAPQYAIVSSPVLYLKAGTYKLRATGTVKLRKYVYRT